MSRDGESVLSRPLAFITTTVITPQQTLLLLSLSVLLFLLIVTSTGLSLTFDLCEINKPTNAKIEGGRTKNTQCRIINES